MKIIFKLRAIALGITLNLFVTQFLVLADNAAIEPRFVNISVNALSFLFGQTSISADFGIAPNLVIGPRFAFWHTTSTDPFSAVKNPDTKVLYLVGADATYFFNQPRFSNSWFTNLGISYARFISKNVNRDGILSSAIAGYGWYWDSGINLSLGLGMSLGVLNEPVVRGYPAPRSQPTFGVIPSGKIQVGYLF